MRKTDTKPLSINTLVALSFLLVSCTCFAQLQCGLSASGTTGCPPFIVSFSDVSTGNPTSHYWNFGNNFTSSANNPTFTFFNPGVYTVKHVVSNSTATDSCFIQITVLSPPIVNFTSPDRYGCIPGCHLVHFQNQIIVGNSPIKDVIWDFGDGSLPVPVSYPFADTSRCYNQAGSYNVTLVVRDTNNCQVSKTLQKFVTIGNQPIATASASPFQSCVSPQLVNFSANSSTPNGPMNFLWAFGDGSTSNSANPSKVYFNGIYNAYLFTADSLGCGDTILKQIQVTDVIAGFTVSSNSSCIKFTDTSNFASNWSWNFGDGTSSNLKNPTHTYAHNGTYSVTLTVSYNGCVDTKSQTFYAQQGQLSWPNNFSVSPIFTDCSKSVVELSTDTVYPFNYEWHFGDGDSSNLHTPTHTYTTSSNFTIALTLTDTSGCSKTLSKQHLFTQGDLNGDFYTTSQFSLCPPFPEQFYVNTGSNLNYFWDFGDTDTSSDPAPIHVYIYPGLYSVKLIISDSTGCSDTITKTNYIKINGPTGSFSLSPDTGVAPLTVAINGTFQGTSGFVCDLGDGTAFQDSIPVNHTYFSPGTYYPVITLHDSLYCVVSYPVDTVHCVAGSSIEQSGPIQIFKVFPNPVYQLLTVMRNDGINKSNATFCIRTLEGKLIEQHILNSFTDYIDVSHLFNGVYIFQIQNAEATLFRTLIVKN